MKLSFYLSDKLFIAKGVHKAVYKHPSNTRYCIKVTFTFRDTDIERELLYRKALKIRNKKPSLLPEYFGSVETNLGPGHVFEYIVDYDNQPSLELKSVFEKNIDVREIFRVTPLEFVRNFREMLLAQKIVVLISLSSVFAGIMIVLLFSGLWFALKFLIASIWVLLAAI